MNFVGNVSDEILPSYYKTADVFCAPSLCGESFGVTLLEAMACGRPVITTDVGLIRRIVAHGVNGYIVERSVDAIADAIEKVRELDIEAMGRLARVSAEAHDWSRKMETWRSCLRAAVEIAERKA